MENEGSSVRGVQVAGNILVNTLGGSVLAELETNSNPDWY
jgi:hypothetical protein